MISMAVCLVLPFAILAQEKPESKKEKKQALKITVKTDGNEAKVIEIDTLLPSAEKVEEIIDQITSEMQLKENELKQLEVELKIGEEALDSLQKKMKQIIIMRGKEGDMLSYFPEEEFQWKMLKEPWDSYSSCIDSYRDRLGDHDFKVIQHPFNPGSWMQQMTPWGKVKKFHIKKKRNGRKIIIKTEYVDGDYSFVYPAMPVPPPPPAPPAPPLPQKKVKKVVIER